MRARELRLLLPFTAMLVTGGCGMMFGDEGVFRDRSEDYKQAPELPVLDVPEDKDTADLQEIYVVPPVEEGVVLRGEFEVPRPTPLIGGAGVEDAVRIQRLGDESWALVELAPGQVWPQVRNFIAAAGMQVARADARAGIIETAWLAIEDKPLASRFRFRMEQGVQRGTSELHVLQMNQTAGSDEWPTRSDDPQQSQEMLRAVAQFLADSADSTPVSMVAEQGISSGGKISLQESPEGNTYIRLELPYYRAWASLARALEESAFEITDRNRSAGIYYARFEAPREDDDKGWFDWLWGDDEHPMEGRMFLVSITELEDGVISIELQPQDDLADFDKRQEQSLLALIKGNID